MVKIKQKTNEIKLRGNKEILNKLSLLVVFLVVAGIIWVGVIVKGDITGKAIFGKQSTATQIKANSCDADDVCEIKRVLGDKVEAKEIRGTKSLYGYRATIDSLTTPYLTVSTKDFTGYLYANKIYADKMSTRDGIDIGDSINISGIIIKRIGYDLNIKSNTTRITGTLVSDTLIGKGNAYACINSEGKLFRYDKPCR